MGVTMALQVRTRVSKKDYGKEDYDKKDPTSIDWP
jgi:hypothetical protein